MTWFRLSWSCKRKGFKELLIKYSSILSSFSLARPGFLVELFQLRQVVEKRHVMVINKKIPGIFHLCAQFLFSFVWVQQWPGNGGGSARGPLICRARAFLQARSTLLLLSDCISGTVDRGGPSLCPAVSRVGLKDGKKTGKKNRNVLPLSIYVWRVD